MQWKHVLFPFDYSHRCWQAVPFVRDLVQKAGACLTILDVVADTRTRYPIKPSQVSQHEQNENVRADITTLCKYARESFPGCTVSAVCRMGDPAQEIVSFARDNQVDLIMMPTHGSGRFRSLLLGSVTAKVLDDTECPVWTDVHLDDDSSSVITVRSIICAVEDKDESVWTLKSASDVASFYSAKLHLVHVVPEVHIRSFTASAQGQNELIQASRLQMSELRHEAGVNADIYVAFGTVSHVVRKVALDLKADLL
jgi:nucleotide-binding universal stress UspA family protein